MRRSLDTLRRDQESILRELRDRQAPTETIALLPRPGQALPVALYGRVTTVVASDPDLGPHLLVRRRRWAGTPPTVTDADTPDILCRPTPNRTVGDYTINDDVRVVATQGAMVAELLP